MSRNVSTGFRSLLLATTMLVVVSLSARADFKDGERAFDKGDYAAAAAE